MSERLSFVWEGDSLDWRDLSAAEITKRVTSKVQPGSIVLFHNAAKNTPEALPSIIEYLLQEGYTVKETALRLGFADQNYFSTVYRRHFGVPPSKERERG